MKTTYYTVWRLSGDSNIHDFKRTADAFVSSHIFKEAADLVAFRCNGHVETDTDALHEDYIKQLVTDDARIVDAILVECSHHNQRGICTLEDYEDSKWRRNPSGMLRVRFATFTQAVPFSGITRICAEESDGPAEGVIGMLQSGG